MKQRLEDYQRQLLQENYDKMRKRGPVLLWGVDVDTLSPEEKHYAVYYFAALYKAQMEELLERIPQMMRLL